jgi:hypothetical protein
LEIVKVDKDLVFGIQRKALPVLEKKAAARGQVGMRCEDDAALH